MTLQFPEQGSPMARVLAALPSLRSTPFWSYLTSSVAALAADSALFWLCVEAGIPSTSAAALGYVLGIAVHWLLSTRWVFRAETAVQGSWERRMQKVMFVASAAIGLALTVGTVGVLVAGGAHPLIAKGLAVAVSFAAVWLIRRQLIFVVRASS